MLVLLVFITDRLWYVVKWLAHLFSWYLHPLQLLLLLLVTLTFNLSQQPDLLLHFRFYIAHHCKLMHQFLLRLDFYLFRMGA